MGHTANFLTILSDRPIFARSFGEDDSPSFMGEDYFCESAITELSSSLAEFGKFVTVSLRV